LAHAARAIPHIHKSSFESLNLDEAMLDNFYMSNITPLFFVECLADLEKAIRSRGIQLKEDLTHRTHCAANARPHRKFLHERSAKQHQRP
jgi:hypothetical protein